MTNEELLFKIREYRENQQMIAVLQDELDNIKATITNHMDTAVFDTLHCDVHTVRWTPYETARIDTTAIKRELPEIADRFTKVTQSRRFSIA